MKDLIYRQDAIDALEEVDWYHQNKNKDMVLGANPSEHQAWYKEDDIFKTLEALPSAQPETANIIVGKSQNGMTMWYQCDNCNEPVDENDLYCRGCGRRFEHGSDR